MYKSLILSSLAWLAINAATAPAQETTAPAVLQFQPPDADTPTRRVGGFVRGAGDPLPAVVNLAPIRVGLTIAEQPVLYWYLSGQSDFPLEISLIGGRSVEPLLEIRIEPPVEAGVHVVRLADYGVALESGQTYEWFVALISDEEVRSKDVVSGAAIKRMDNSQRVKARIAGAEPEQWARIYAEEGLWYDLVETLSEAIRLAPENTALRASRANLMEQVSLFSIETYDRQFLESSTN